MALKSGADFSDRMILEKYSSAFTLSDMEIFIFPDLFYPLVLANIMSPIIWTWRDDPWFSGIGKKSFTYKANRIKQFIIQNYIFNLDLSTWGLTTKGRELERFKDFFDMNLLRQSNALFGYEGDKYYFDMDIRKHFGLDKFNTDVIPYWKTETIEAMTAFRYKENFTTGAGECVSLSALYAAALFVVGRIPLEKMFLIATPLHSQNFVTEKEGLITNNRRIVTKNMWFNGTSLSEKARRALENEKVTIVSHISGYIHTIYNKATIDSKAYEYFTSRIREFLVTELTSHVFINFLRFKTGFKVHFQFECECSGKKRYISLEKLFEYEHNSKFSVGAETRAQLIKEIEGEEFHLSQLQGKIMLNEAEELIERNQGKSLGEIKSLFMEIKGEIPGEEIDEMFSEIEKFISTDPKLPDPEKEFIQSAVPEIKIENSREDILNKVNSMAEKSELALLSLYVYRQMDRIDWLPFVKAAIERNPVCFSDLSKWSINEIFEKISALDDMSIYDGNRLALPDEVWNFKRGDGIEKALLMADLIINKDPEAVLRIETDHKMVVLTHANMEYRFHSSKSIRKSIRIRGNVIETD